MHVAFSLVEMLMALLVASLLMVALAPVMTKKFNETVNVGGGNGQFVHTITYGSSFCPVDTEPKKYEDGSEYCEGEFTVPIGVNKISVTLVGGGAGGAAGRLAGFSDWKEPGTKVFNVPNSVDEIETTLVAGGSGGGAGGHVLRNITFVANDDGGVTNPDENNVVKMISSGEEDWTIPIELRGKKAIATGCGGGGGAAGGSSNAVRISGGGGSGAYIKDEIITVPYQDSITVTIGGGGGYGGHECTGYPTWGNFYGGGGGAGCWGPVGSGGGASSSQTGSYGHGGAPTLRSGVDASYFPSGGKGGMGGGGNGEDGFYIEDDVKKPITNTSHPGNTSTTSRLTYGGKGSGGAGGRGSYFNYSTSVPDSDYNGWTAGSGGGAGGLIGAGGGGAGAAGGGGGGGRTAFGSVFIVPGGGGGGATVHGGGGGGGAGQTVDGTGKGGAGGSVQGGGGYGGTPNGGNGNAKTAGVPGIVNGGTIERPIFGNNYCNGGTGVRYDETLSDVEKGKNGALRISYLAAKSGGGGGGSGSVSPAIKLPVTGGEVLNVKVGEGAPGGIAGEIIAVGDIRAAGYGKGTVNQEYTYRMQSQIMRGEGEENLILSSCYRAATGFYYGCNNWGGSPSGTQETYYGAGAVSNNGGVEEASKTKSHSLAGFWGYSGSWGTQAEGKQGGSWLLFGLPYCTPGAGGKDISKSAELNNGLISETEKEQRIKEALKGQDATGYGGCGGGGGYSLYDGGAGSPGYVRMTWGKLYKAGTKEQYEYVKGSGGGGAAGNVLKYTLSVEGGQVIKYKIGKGGKGGSWNVNEEVAAQNGGATELTIDDVVTLRAGGGLAGAFPLLSAIVEDYRINKYEYGKGGAVSSDCYVKIGSDKKDYLNNNKYCKVDAGADGDENGGGKGGDAGFNLGQGGSGGLLGNNLESAKGQIGGGYGTGGGGAALYDMGVVDGTTASTNGLVGGNGKDGVIVLRW